MDPKKCIAFPNKKASVLQFCQAEIVHFCTKMIINSSPELLSNARLSLPEDMSAKYFRVIACSIQLLETLIVLSYSTVSLTVSDLQMNKSQYSSLFDFKILDTYQKERKSVGIWDLFSHEQAIIRRNTYSLLSNLCKVWPDSIDQPCLSKISTKFLGKIFSNERDPSVQPQMWEAIVVFTSVFPQSWVIANGGTDFVSIEGEREENDELEQKQKKKGPKPVLPKFFSYIKNGGFDSSSIYVMYPSLLPIIAHLPDETSPLIF
ncbi:listerin E3 ubiquitin protein ligase 1 [Nowakowskiella sp. JEL0078]|nr:listerin E3 ubiquitin protein ligase 1 [Nowakowskiella sp. JEL0078]